MDFCSSRKRLDVGHAHRWATEFKEPSREAVEGVDDSFLACNAHTFDFDQLGAGGGIEHIGPVLLGLDRAHPDLGIAGLPACGADELRRAQVDVEAVGNEELAGHEGSHAMPPDDRALLMKDVQGIAQGVATHAEGSREFNLGRELGAGLQLAADDQFSNVFADLPGFPLFEGRPSKQTKV